VAFDRSVVSRALGSSERWGVPLTIHAYGRADERTNGRASGTNERRDLCGVCQLAVFVPTCLTTEFVA
jgi:hypothetical protein